MYLFFVTEKYKGMVLFLAGEKSNKHHKSFGKKMHYNDDVSLTDLTLNWYNERKGIIPKHICAVDSMEIQRFFKLVPITIYSVPNEHSEMIKQTIFKFRDNI